MEQVALHEGVEGGYARFLEGHALQGVVALVTGERAGDGVRWPARLNTCDLVARQRGCVARLRMMQNCFAKVAVSVLRNHVAHRSRMIVSFGVTEDAAVQKKVDFRFGSFAVVCSAKGTSASPSKGDMCDATKDVRSGSKADICNAKRHVRFTRESDIKCDMIECPLWANSGRRPLRINLYSFR